MSRSRGWDLHRVLLLSWSTSRARLCDVLGWYTDAVCRATVSLSPLAGDGDPVGSCAQPTDVFWLAGEGFGAEGAKVAATTAPSAITAAPMNSHEKPDVSASG